MYYSVYIDLLGRDIKQKFPHLSGRVSLRKKNHIIVQHTTSTILVCDFKVATALVEFL
jgi:hypothetical protein